MVKGSPSRMSFRFTGWREAERLAWKRLMVLQTGPDPPGVHSHSNRPGDALTSPAGDLLGQAENLSQGGLMDCSEGNAIGGTIWPMT